MKLLILGGTLFLGRHIAEVALGRGHDVTLFTRGKTNPDLFPEAERIAGDRKVDLSPLSGRRWDAVIDTCGYAPRIVRMSADALRDSVDHYTFVSSISAYADFNTPGIREDAALGTLKEPTEDVTLESYGPLKALCEAEAQAVFGDRALINRPGLLVGPYDPTERFTYWPMRIARGGDVLAPGNPDAEMQVIDTRDAAEWMVDCAERRVAGVYNMTGPAAPTTMRQLLDTARETLNPSARLVWATEKFLLDNKVAPWSDMPLWLPPDMGGMLSVDISRALAAGLAPRPLSETIGDTYEWRKSAADPSAAPTASGAARPKAGIDEARERELLERWQAAQ
jgi:2'-hydroxyisoflavone reductase